LGVKNTLLRRLAYIGNRTSEYYPDLKAATESLRKLGWIKGKKRKEKQLFRCKRDCPKALYCQLTKNGVTAYESIC